MIFLSWRAILRLRFCIFPICSMKKLSVHAIGLQGAFLAALLVPFGVLASRSGEDDSCEHLRGAAKAICKQVQRHDDDGNDDDASSSSVSSVRSSKSSSDDKKACKAVLKTWKKSEIIAHKEWHQANKVGDENEALHKQWHKNSRMQEKALKLRIKNGDCTAVSSSSTSSNSSSSVSSSSVSSVSTTSSSVSSAVSSSSSVSSASSTTSTSSSVSSSSSN